MQEQKPNNSETRNNVGDGIEFGSEPCRHRELPILKRVGDGGWIALATDDDSFASLLRNLHEQNRTKGNMHYHII